MRMDEDIKLERDVVQGTISGLEDVAHELIDADESLTPAERAIRHAVAKGLRGFLASLADSVADSVQDRRDS
jgi:hypothetical protein